MIRTRFITLAALTLLVSTGAQSAPNLTTPQAESPRRNAVAIQAGGAERKLTYLAPDTAAPVKVRAEQQSVQATPVVETGDENNAPAVFAVGLMIAAFTVLRRLN